MYGIKKVDEVHLIKSPLYIKQKTQYIFTINKYSNERVIKEEDIQKVSLKKLFIELIIRDILNSNPNLESYKGIYIMKNNKKTIYTDKNAINLYPGFSTNIIETDYGNYINITLKNRIQRNESILVFINKYQYKNKEELQNEIKNELIGRSFKVHYIKKKFIINDILFDRNPNNQMIIYENSNINLIDYYKKLYNIRIKEHNQPLLLVNKKDSKGNIINMYFIPELCFFEGLNNDITKDTYLMRQINKMIHLSPEEMINITNKFIELFKDPSKDRNLQDRLSSKENSDLYGFEIGPLKNFFKGYYMKNTNLIGEIIK